nr:MAG TPA: hypothetical protein [Caudoviricetes sp.]
MTEIFYLPELISFHTLVLHILRPSFWILYRALPHAL